MKIDKDPETTTTHTKETQSGKKKTQKQNMIYYGSPMYVNCKKKCLVTPFFHFNLVNRAGIMLPNNNLKRKNTHRYTRLNSF